MVAPALVAGFVARRAAARVGAGAVGQAVAAAGASQAVRSDGAELEQLLGDTPVNTSGPVESAVLDLF